MVKSVTTNSGEADAKRATYHYVGFGQAVRSACPTARRRPTATTHAIG